MIDEKKIIEEIDKRLKKEQSKGKLTKFLVEQGFVFAEMPNKPSKVKKKKESWPQKSLRHNRWRLLKVCIKK